ncbi:hypothetical protein, partial [Methylobacterium sp. 174MFSha1.1]|uniref:hypothetical protein n=1 Tax=Methylobacterium sp. 174MFSha1.1 TaxID=1502749 RepID=UPI00116017B5
MIRQPSNNIKFDLSLDRLLAWAQPDEPSNTTTTVDYGHVNLDPKELLQYAEPLREAAAAAGRDMPIWANHVGNHITDSWASESALMFDYMEGSESDWLASDSYQIQFTGSLTIERDGYMSTNQGIALDRVRSWSDDKPSFSFIGTSAINSNGFQPTAGQIEAQIWSSIIHGSSGIIYFSIDFSKGFEWDSTSPDVVDAITHANQVIEENSDLLMQSVQQNNKRVIYRSAAKGANPDLNELPYPFEAVEITSDNKKYYIVVNLSDTTQVFTADLFGLRNQIFDPYQTINNLPIKNIIDNDHGAIITPTSPEDDGTILTPYPLDNKENFDGGIHTVTTYTDGNVNTIKKYNADWSLMTGQTFDL